MFYRRMAAALLLPLMLGAWTPPAAVLDRPILIPAEGGGDHDTGLTLRQFMRNCGHLFGNGKLEFARRADDGFSMRCAFANPKTGQIFSNVSEFTPAILGHHDAIKLERFRGPDGLLQTPAQLKEVFESVYRLTAKPQEGNSLHFVANTQPPDAYLALRTQPNSRQGSRIKIMPNGTLLQVLQRRNDGWWQVRIVPSGEEGWTLSSQGNRQWIRCCSTFDPQEDSVAITLDELNQKFRNHPAVLSEIEQERRGFRPEARCILEYWVKQSQTSSEIIINCQSYATGGEADESSVTMIFTVDPAGKMLLTKKDYAG